MTENSDPNGHVTDEELELLKEMDEEDLKFAEFMEALDDYLAPKWWVEDPFYGDVD